VLVPDGVKLPETPLGSPLTLQVTVPLNPRMGVYLAVYVVDFPALIVRLVGEAETEKSAAQNYAYPVVGALAALVHNPFPAATVYEWFAVSPGVSVNGEAAAFPTGAPSRYTL